MSPKLGETGHEAVNRIEKGTVNVGVILRGIRRFPLIALASVILASIATAGVWFFLPLPKMTAYSVFQIDALPDAVINPEAFFRS